MADSEETDSGRNLESKAEGNIRSETKGWTESGAEGRTEEGPVETIEFNGEPWLVEEKGNGLLYVVKRILSGKNWMDYEYYKDRFGGLWLDIDLREVPVRNIRFIVDIPLSNPIASYIIAPVKEIARLGDYAAFGLQDIGADPARLRGSNGSMRYYEVRPRLFRWMNKSSEKSERSRRGIK